MKRKSKEVSFDVNRKDAASIRRLARRAHSLAIEYRFDYPLLEASMDLTACHANGCPLDLAFSASNVISTARPAS